MIVNVQTIHKTFTFPLFLLVVSWIRQDLIKDHQIEGSLETPVTDAGKFILLNVTSVVVVLDGYEVYEVVAEQPPLTVPRLAQSYVFSNHTIYFFRVLGNATTVTSLYYFTDSYLDSSREYELNFTDPNYLIGTIVLTFEVARRLRALEYDEG